MNNKRTSRGGWFNQPDRHALASKGVQTTTKSYALSSRIPKSYERAKQRINTHISKIYHKNLLGKNKDSLELYRELITIEKIIDKNDMDISTDELNEMIDYLDKKLDGKHDETLDLEKKFDEFLDRWDKYQRGIR